MIRASLADSNAFFDYDGDGVAEHTGWVSADDGFLAIDANANGHIDGVNELFGSPTQDGFAVLETYDLNYDGVIDANDAVFDKLRVWRDLNQNGVTDAGELQTLAESGITSINLTRTDVQGTLAGHTRGFAGSFTRTDGTGGTAETIYFQTDRADTADPTPAFTLAEGVDRLPQLPRSGQLNDIAYKLSTDASFRADWTALVDRAAGIWRQANLRGNATGQRDHTHKGLKLVLRHNQCGRRSTTGARWNAPPTRSLTAHN